jgi:hypothetical protein
MHRLVSLRVLSQRSPVRAFKILISHFFLLLIQTGGSIVGSSDDRSETPASHARASDLRAIRKPKRICFTASTEVA